MDKKSILFHVTEQELSPSNSDYCHISKIDEYEDNSIDEIIIQDLCDYLTESDIPNLLSKIFQKLNSNGNLYIQASDLKQLCIAVTFGMVDENIIKKVLYPNKKSIRNMSDILKYLKDLDFRISNKKYINVFEYYIKAYKYE